MSEKLLVRVWHGTFLLAIISGVITGENYLIHAGICALMGFWLGRVTA